MLLERGDDVGGTWRANTYPGCQCDVPSNLYPFSFAPKTDWGRAYPMQDEILGYLRDCARSFGVLDRTHFETDFLDASWDGSRGRWEVETSRGRTSARVLVAAPGLLSEPSIPPLPGLDRFEGVTFYTARWDQTHDLSGRTVAIFGTGATAIQVVPQVREQVQQLTIFQRTPGFTFEYRRRTRRFEAVDYTLSPPVASEQPALPVSG